jgi:predicted acylesterase/phospholipase RssA
MSDALVLAGAVAKGAFTAGALSVLSEPETQARLGIDVSRVVGASSGALNGVYYAAEIHAGREAYAGQRLAEMWIEDASLRGAFHISLGDIVRRLGFSSHEEIFELLRREIHPTPARRAVQLRVIITNSAGEPTLVAGSPATTFEHVERIESADFETAAALERVYVATVASLSLPGLYAPMPMEIDGRTVQALDGGLVDDSPLGVALEDAPDIDRVFVIAPFPRVRLEPQPLHGLPLAGHVFDLLIQERLIGDLDRADQVNRFLERLPSIVERPAERAAVLEALGWQGRRSVEIVEIRPDADLPGNSFSGLAFRSLRREYVEQGVAAARRVLGGLTPGATAGR